MIFEPISVRQAVPIGLSIVINKTTAFRLTVPLGYLELAGRCSVTFILSLDHFYWDVSFFG